MAKVYGDVVVLVRKAQDGTISRANAIVLASTVKAPLTLDRRQIKDAKPVEHLDVAFPELSLAPNGQVLKTRNLEEIFRPAYDVAPWEEGNWIGFEEPDITEAAPQTPPDGHVVPLAQLVDLACEVSRFDPSLEVSPDAVVPSAILALGRATATLNQKPEPAPPQPEVAEAAQDATQADAQTETGSQQGSQETANEG